MNKALKNSVFLASVAGFAIVAALSFAPLASAYYGGGYSGNYGGNGGYGNYYNNRSNPPTYQIFYPNGFSQTVYQPGYSFPGQRYVPTPYVPTPPVWSLPTRWSGSNNYGGGYGNYGGGYGYGQI